MDARLYLREMMVSLVDSFNASGQPDLTAIRSQLQGAARAFVATGDLPPGGVHELLTEFEGLLEERGMAKRVEHFGAVSSTIGVTRDPDAPEMPQSPSPRPAGPVQLHAVVPINETMAEFAGYTVTAISLELWSKHVSFRYAVHGEDMRQLLGGRGMTDLRWEAYDDRGGVHPRSGGSAGSAGTGGITGEVNFAGPIADGARQFVVRLRYRDEGPMSALIDLPGQQG